MSIDPFFVKLSRAIGCGECIVVYSYYLLNVALLSSLLLN